MLREPPELDPRQRPADVRLLYLSTESSRGGRRDNLFVDFFVHLWRTGAILGNILFAGPTGAQALKPHVVARGDLRALSVNVRDLDVRKLALERLELVVVLAHWRKGRGGRAERDVGAAPDRETSGRRGRGAPRSAFAQAGREQRDSE
jgi:hypothetical protein